MQSISDILPVLVIFALTLLINLPFGYLRKKERRFSFRWFLYIHLPIPIIVAARIVSQIDFRYIPFFVAAAMIGQFLGGRIEV